MQVPWSQGISKHAGMHLHFGTILYGVMGLKRRFYHISNRPSRRPSIHTASGIGAPKARSIGVRKCVLK
jgi:hypothetical protein